jgi:hypothetical protein
MILRIYELIANVSIENDVNLPRTVLGENTVTSALQIVFGLAGAIAFLIVVLAGFQYVISQGNPQATNKAKDTILYAVIGLVISLSAVAIISFATGSLFG